MKKIVRKIVGAVTTMAMLIPATIALPMTASAYTASNVPSYLFDAEYYSNMYDPE